MVEGEGGGRGTNLDATGINEGKKIGMERN